MPWVSVEKKVIGEVEIQEKGVPPVPGAPAPPTPGIQSFLDEHRKLKGIIDKQGGRGACVTRSTLEREGKVSGERLNQHIRVFENSDAASPITEEGEEVLCGKDAVRELKRKLEVEL